ncbi:glycosyltransferase family 4 protein [Candidatus Parcubacteria bacterium]|nr:glycosyltransferase family 4 protein [Candidatus Parcubacteria bacterium]
MEEKGKKNIFLLCTRADMGGVQVFIRDLARDLKRRGILVTVGFGPAGGFLANELRKFNIPYIRFQNLKRSHNPFTSLSFISEFKRFLNKNNFTTIHINSSNALIAAYAVKKCLPRTLAKHSMARGKSRPITIFTVHGLSLLDENYKKANWFKAFYLFYFKFFLKFVDKLIFISAENQKQTKSLNIAQENHMIYNGLEPSSINMLSHHEAQGQLSSAANPKLHLNWIDSFAIGSVGRLSYQKNYDFLINIFPKILRVIPNAKLIIIGEGEDRAKLEEMIKTRKLKKSIFLTGNIINSAKYLPAFDLFILPSRYEGLPLTLIESLFAGLPMLVTEVGGNTEILNNSSGQIFKLNDEDDFLKKFKNLAEHKMHRDYLSRQNKKQSQNFLLSKSVDKYLELYE